MQANEIQQLQADVIDLARRKLGAHLTFDPRIDEEMRALCMETLARLKAAGHKEIGLDQFYPIFMQVAVERILELKDAARKV